MSRAEPRWVVVFVAIVGTGLWVGTRAHTQQTSHAPVDGAAHGRLLAQGKALALTASEASQAVDEGYGTPTPDDVAKDGSINAGEEPEIVRARVTPPTVEQIRGDIEANPHITPPSLLVFAVRAYERMEQVRSQEAARALMDEIKSTMVEPELLPAVVQATYLEQARELAERYPALADAADVMWHSASQEVLALMD